MAFLANAARSAYDMAFQISPIILTGGIAQSMPGAAVPVIALVGQLMNVGLNFLTSGVGLSDIGPRFVPLPGSQVIANAVGTYPFANQSVAANAIVAQPLTLSMQMIAPVNADFGYVTKLATFSALRESFAQHNAQGGTYSVATPSYIYTDCLMTGMTDITPATTHQQQTIWQLDFMQPLVTMEAAEQAMNSLMQKLSGGSQVTSSSPSSPFGNAAQGALQSVGNLFGNVTQFLAQPAL